MTLSKEAKELKSKIALSRKKFSAIRRKADFDVYRTGLLIEFARFTKNSALLEVLACHPDNTVRDEVAYNQFSSYETLLGLLGDTDIEVIRTVLLFGKLKEEDFTVLSEKFFPKKERGLFFKLNENEYLPLIKLKGKLARWNASQSFYLLHNKHLGITALNNLDINSFAPFRGNGLKILTKLRDTRITEVRNNLPVSKRKRAPEGTLPSHWGMYRRKRQSSLSSEESNEIEIYLSQQINSQKNPSRNKKKLAASDDISRDQLTKLLNSNDKKIVTSALRSTKITVKELDDKFCDFPEIVLENPKFHGRLERKPGLLRWMDANKKIKILKNKKDCPSLISKSLVKDYADYIKSPYISVSDSMSKWGNWLQVIVSHGSTGGDSLNDLYQLVYTSNKNISEKRSNLIKTIEKNPKFKKI